jgi:hypothetical protein
MIVRRRGLIICKRRKEKVRAWLAAGERVEVASLGFAPSLRDWTFLVGWFPGFRPPERTPPWAIIEPSLRDEGRKTAGWGEMRTAAINDRR